MTFLKLGDRYLNPEMITDIFVQDRRPDQPEVHAEIYLSAPMGEHATSEEPLSAQTRHLHVSGEEAERLIRWLEAHLEKE